MEGAIEVPLFPYAYFQAIRVGVYHHIGSFCSLAVSLSGKKERQGFQMRKFKTADKNRTNYIYYTSEGTKVVLNPEHDGIDEIWITILHKLDDDQFDAERREEYHCPVRVDGYYIGNCDSAGERNQYLQDDTYNPLEQILISIATDEHNSLIEKLRIAVSELTDKQQSTIFKKFYLNMTNVDIAAEEGVSEAAIRNRLSKIYAALKKKI